MSGSDQMDYDDRGSTRPGRTGGDNTEAEAAILISISCRFQIGRWRLIAQSVISRMSGAGVYVNLLLRLTYVCRLSA